MATFKVARLTARRSAAWAGLILPMLETERGRNYWDDAAIAFFDADCIGEPVTAPYSTRTYWIERHVLGFSDGTFATDYRLKATGDGVGNVDTVSDTPHYATAVEATAAMRFIAGVAL